MISFHFARLIRGSGWLLTNEFLWTWQWNQVISESNLVKWAHIRQCIDDGCKTYMDIKDIIQCVYISIFHIQVDRILVISCDHFYCLLSCHECSKLGLHDQIAKTFWPTICNYFHQCITASLVRLRNRGVASPRPGGGRVALCHCSWDLKACCFQ